MYNITRDCCLFLLLRIWSVIAVHYQISRSAQFRCTHSLLIRMRARVYNVSATWWFSCRTTISKTRVFDDCDIATKLTKSIHVCACTYRSSWCVINVVNMFEIEARVSYLSRCVHIIVCALSFFVVVCGTHITYCVCMSWLPVNKVLNKMIFHHSLLLVHFFPDDKQNISYYHHFQWKRIRNDMNKTSGCCVYVLCLQQ